MDVQKKNIDSFFEFDRKELFIVLLDLLEFFRSFCDKHRLRFFAQGGTMLGAVRHNGFIPWDDDIDLAMLRSDFDQLLRLIKTEKLPEPYAFLTPFTDDQYYKGIVRLCNKNTTAISINNAAFNYNHGIFIDIFPLDAIPDNPFLLKLYKLEVDSLRRLLISACRYNMGKVGKEGLKSVAKVEYGLLYPFFRCGLINTEKVFSLLTKVASRYKDKKQKRICLSTFMIVDKYINYMADYECDIFEFPFETTTIPLPARYDVILRRHFGDNYMTPVKEKTMHGDTLYSTSIPYKEFVHHFEKELIDKWLEYRNSL